MSGGDSGGLSGGNRDDCVRAWKKQQSDLEAGKIGGPFWKFENGGFLSVVAGIRPSLPR